MTRLKTVLVLAVLMTSLPVSAQTPVEPALEHEPAPGVTAAPERCTPACAAGTFCSNGQCLSTCNPPCAADEICTEQGQCALVLPAPPGPPPALPAAAPRARPVEPPLPPPQPETDVGVRTHDGFYFRVALGAGVFSGSHTFHPNQASVNPLQFDFDSSGFAIMSELAFGGSPVPGLVIGGGSYGASVPTTTYEVAGQEVEGESSALSVLGPFVDVYPDPGGGLHFQLAAGLGAMSLVEGDFIGDDFGGIGLGLMAGAGYEAWVGEQWSIGGLVRVLYASTTLEGPAQSERIDAQAFSPGVLFTATYH